ncbi:MAG: signal recognition particle protein [Caldiserica bacterium]|nr:signal recognition particle protein [Caldisericota bacterium]
MFEGLKENLEKVFKRLRSKGRLSEEDIHTALREVRIALFESDVNYKVAKEVVSRVGESAKSEKVIESLTPSEQVITILYRELVGIVGESAPLNIDPNRQNFIMLVGLQGNGKTTTAAKIAKFLKGKGYKPLLIPLDFKRPGAHEQLVDLGERNGLPVFKDTSGEPVSVIKDAVSYMEEQGFNIGIVDTAGRKEIDTDLMDELKIVHEVLKPQETLLVMDSTIGQGALRVCQGFLDFVDLTGSIFTKFDSSAKGGSVLSFRYVTGKPVKFIGVGEKIDDLETFEPERLISRILGRGDIQTLVEKAQKAISEEESVKLLKKVSEGSFDLNDFREELQSLAKMGGISSIASYLPFASQMKLPANFSDDKMTRKMVAIINSMTKEERENPDIINGSRRERIAKGAGVEKYDVNLLLKNYFNFKKLIKNVKSIDSIIKFR